ncbi:MAG: hypothetical protein A2284_04000 [Deltaproteobacteria bacterium RIFOXYA12_FULL_61_11]|nr:MAG: hypothetical protein A2284_04000 [Deltaproteobacteria bacterium RIFOXYA12_FULL_61_11]
MKRYVLHLLWVACLLAVLTLALASNLQSASFYGIAESGELVITRETSVEIVRLHAVEGQSVYQGQLLLELNNPDLALRIRQLRLNLDGVAAQRNDAMERVEAELLQLRAESEAQRSGLLHELATLENRAELNRQLSATLPSLQADPAEPATESTLSPLALKRRQLEESLRFDTEKSKTRRATLERQRRAVVQPFDLQLDKLNEELRNLETENGNLRVVAPLDGIVSTVHVKPGERLSPFAPILTFSAQTPSFIKGYVVEKQRFAVRVGQEAVIRSLGGSNSMSPASVVGVGSRIVEVPERLCRHVDLRLWGREVVLKLPRNTSFVLGEKVSITLDHPRSLQQLLDSLLQVRGERQNPESLFADTDASREPRSAPESHPPEEATLR